MTTVKLEESLMSENVQPSHRPPTVDHCRDDVFSDVKPSVEGELPLSSNTDLQQQEELTLYPSSSTLKMPLSGFKSSNVLATVANGSSLATPPVPVLCVQNAFIETVCDPHNHQQIYQNVHANRNENCSYEKRGEGIQPSEIQVEEADLHRPFVDDSVSEKAFDVNSDYMRMKLSYCKSLSSGEIINEGFPLSNSVLTDWKEPYNSHRLKQSRGISFAMRSSDANTGTATVSMKTETEESDCLNVKSECLDEFVPRRSERVLDQFNVKSEYPDELDPRQSDSKREIGHFDSKTETINKNIPRQLDREVDHTVVKNEFSKVQFVPGNSEKEAQAGPLDPVRYTSPGDKGHSRVEDSIMMDCDPDNVFVIEQNDAFICSMCLKDFNSLAGVNRHIAEGHTQSKVTSLPVGTTASQCQHLTSHEAQGVDDIDEIQGRGSPTKNLTISRHQHGPQPRQTETASKQDGDIHTVAVNDVDVTPLNELTQPDDQRLENVMELRCLDPRQCAHVRNPNFTLFESSVVSSLSHEDNNCEPPESCSGRNSESKCEKNDSEAMNQVASHLTWSEALKQSITRDNKVSISVDSSGCAQNASRRTTLKSDDMCHERKESVDCSECSRTFSRNNDDISKVGEINGGNLFKCKNCNDSSSPNPRISHKEITGEKPHKCSECDKMFNVRNALREHVMQIHNREKPHKCDECGRACCKSSFNYHVLTKNSGEKSFTCNECGKSFYSQTSLCVHMRTHRTKKPFMSNDCAETSAQNRSPTRHKRMHAGERPFKCRDCGKTFIDKSAVKKHGQIHTGEKPFECNKCGKMFGTRTNFKRHLLTHTGEKPFQCTECDRCFLRKSSLYSHMKIHSGEKLFKCNECGKAFRRSTDLKEHMRKHTGEKPFKCNQCGKSFFSHTSRRVHVRTHTNEKPFMCNECGKTFTQNHSLTCHMRIHTGEKPFMCNECGMTFARKYYLTKHMRTHTRERPFKCGDCGKTFVDKGTVKKHAKTHTGEKPIECDKCGKMFGTRTLLRRHLVTHTGEKLFQCTECDDCFLRKSTLYLHMKIHSGEKPFKCNQCSKAFGRSTGLKYHMRIHTGEKPFKCNECSKAFRRSNDLKYHMRIHTGEKTFKCK